MENQFLSRPCWYLDIFWQLEALSDILNVIIKLTYKITKGYFIDFFHKNSEFPPDSYQSPHILTASHDQKSTVGITYFQFYIYMCVDLAKKYLYIVLLDLAQPKPDTIVWVVRWSELITLDLYVMGMFLCSHFVQTHTFLYYFSGYFFQIS